jgi:hypothetical protein
LLKEFVERGVAAITYPPQTSHLFQIFDLLLFGRLKAAQTYIPRADADPTDTDHLLRIFKAYELVTTSTTVSASWKKPDSSTANWMIYSNYLLTMGRFGIGRNSPKFGACIFLWRGYRLSGEYKKRIHEQAVFQGKIPEDSQTTRTRLNNNS